MLAGFKGYGQSPENGAKPLVYACCAPENDLRGRVLEGAVSRSMVDRVCEHGMVDVLHKSMLRVARGQLLLQKYA